jgi:predicted dehydrogenase
MGPVENVFAQTGRLLHDYIEAEDTAQAIIRFKSGAFGIIEASTAMYPGFEARIELTGSNGTIILEDGFIIKADIKEPAAELKITPPVGKITGGSSDPVNGKPYEYHFRQVVDFTDAILKKGIIGWMVKKPDSRAQLF